MEEIDFPPDVRTMLWILLGEMPLQARENLAWESRNLYLALQRGLIDLRAAARETIQIVEQAMPPEVARPYIESVRMLTDEPNGTDPVQALLNQLDEMANGQVDYSQKIQASKWEIIAEIIMLIAELAILAALIAFTGGASVTQMFIARARKKLAILMIVDRLLRMTHIAPTLGEAIQEAIQTLAVRLAQIALNPGGRKPGGVDWKDVGVAAAFGALTAGFMEIFEKFLKPIKNYFKDLLGDIFSKFKIDPNSNLFKGLVNGPPTVVTVFVVGGAAESTAEVIINGAFYDKWEFKWETFVGSGTSTVFDLGAGLAVGAGAFSIYNNYFNNNRFTEINDMPGPNSILGGGDGGPSGSEKPGGPASGTDVKGPPLVKANPFTPGPATPYPNTVSADLPNGPGSGIGTLPPPTFTPPSAVSPPAGVNTLPKSGSDALTRPTDFTPRDVSGPGPNSLLNPGNVVGPNGVVGSNGVIGSDGVTGSNGIPGTNGVPGTSGSPLPQLPPPTSSLPSSTPSTLPSSSLPDSTPMTPPPTSGRTSGPGTNTDLTSYDLTPETTPDLTPELTPDLTPDLAPDLLPGTSPDTSGATDDLPGNLGGPKGSSSAPDPSAIGGSDGTDRAGLPDEAREGTGTDADADAVAPPAPVATSTGPNAPAPAAGNQGTPQGSQQGNSGTGNPAQQPSQQPSQNGPAEPGDADHLPGEQETDQDADGRQDTADDSGNPAPQPRDTGADDTARTPGAGRTTGPEDAPAAPEAVRTSSDLPADGVTGDTTGHLGTGTGLAAGPAPEPAVPVADPVRPEQWRPGRADAPATAVRIDPSSDPGRAPADPAPLDGPETPVRAWVQRVQADDGRWLSNVSLHLPVRTGEGFSPAELDALQERMRTLLDTHLNHGLQLPGSGDQLHIDVTLTAAPDHAEAVELSRTARPEGSDHLNWRLHSTDPAATPEEAAERRTRDDAAVLQHLLGYAGVPGRGPAAEALLRELVRQSATGAPAPGPAVPQHFLRAVESVVTSAAVVDHPLTARGTRPPSGIDDPSQALRTPAPRSADPGTPVPAAVPFRTTSSAPTETGAATRAPGAATEADADTEVQPVTGQESVARNAEQPPPAAVPLATEGRSDGPGPTPGAGGKGKGRSTDRETTPADEPVLLDFPGTAAVDDAVDAARRAYEDAAA
ncbi:hypothetical protein G3I63_30045, partial [Streptomyces sp. SID8016]|nr:hypothetical protein [Streptomyces sp. SID8016]